MRTIIYGLGSVFCEFMQSNDATQMEIVALCATDVSKYGKSFRGYPVIAPSEIINQEFDEILITNYAHVEEIKEKLAQLKIDERKVRVYNGTGDKLSAELGFWINERIKSKKSNADIRKDYEQCMLRAANEKNDDFLKGKIVGDFGCGPNGSLAWTNAPLVKVGIDVLADQYWTKFGESMRSHDMIYVKSSEESIPIGDSYFDYLFAVNSLDHVENLASMSNEIARIIKPGGKLLANFNLNEPATPTEPQTLTPALLRECLLNKFSIESIRIAYQGEAGEKNLAVLKQNFVSENELDLNRPAVMMCVARKK